MRACARVRCAWLLRVFMQFAAGGAYRGVADASGAVGSLACLFLDILKLPRLHEIPKE